MDGITFWLCLWLSRRVRVELVLWNAQRMDLSLRSIGGGDWINLWRKTLLALPVPVMNQSAFTYGDYMHAELAVASIEANLAILFQMEGEKFDRETMQRHVNDRAALNRVRELLLTEAERILR